MCELHLCDVEQGYISEVYLNPLRELHVCNLNGDRDFSIWVASLVAMGYDSLRYLHVGSENLAVRKYCDGEMYNDSLPENGLASDLSETVAEAITDVAGCHTPLLVLESLRLTGLDAVALLHNPNEAFINFANLTSLVMESCCNVADLFPSLIAKNGGQGPGDDLRLRSLTIRQENCPPPYQSQLEMFLCSLRGLDSLFILLEGVSSATKILNILNVHAKTLQRLLWDERTTKRSSSTNDTSARRPSNKHLATIANRCPQLIELGVRINWSKECQHTVSVVRIDVRSGVADGR